MSPPVSTSFFFNDTATTEIYTLSLHDALPIWRPCAVRDLGQLERAVRPGGGEPDRHLRVERSEEHTSELQSRSDLVCRLLLEKKNNGPALNPHRIASDVGVDGVIDHIPPAIGH